jgi:alpha-tubulin suppressor-like RCC1 family protein
LKKVCLGFGHVLVLTESGDVFGFGMNRHGQAGAEFAPVRSKITKFAENIIDIAAGSTHSLLLAADHTVLSLGSAGDGKLGRMDATDCFAPIPIEFDSNVRISALFAGCDHSIALGDDGKAFGWGFGQHGAVGTGRLATENEPKKVDFEASFDSVWPGTDFTLFEIKT